MYNYWSYKVQSREANEPLHANLEPSPLAVIRARR